MSATSVAEGSELCVALPHLVFDTFYEYLLVRSADWRSQYARQAHYTDFEAASEFEAKRVLRALAVSHRAALLRFCSESSLRTHRHCVSTDELLQTALEAVGFGRSSSARSGLPIGAAFYLLRRSARRVDAPQWRVVRKERVYDPPPERPRAPPKPIHTITLRVVGTTGSPIADVPCEIVLADGALRNVVTNEDGYVFLRGVPFGTCRIRLPRVPAQRWKPLGGPVPAIAHTEPQQTHIVRQGECLSKIAVLYRVVDAMQLWNDEKNEALRKKRKSPHILLPGDSLVVPGMAIGEVKKQTDAVHVLVLAQDDKLVTVRLRLEARWKKALEGLSYTLSFMHRGELVTRPGAGPTGGAGLIEEKVPAQVSAVVIAFERPRLHFKLLVSALDPIQDGESGPVITSGVRARLSALGFTAAGADDSHAIARFQKAELSRDEPTGQLDTETRDKLEELYGA
ncbi:MAG: hypothetical protein JWN04_5862 [Myxococcaceae bacterium]|nr:hypothetical protein [Myxococcaceae bacterium]